MLRIKLFCDVLYVFPYLDMWYWPRVMTRPKMKSETNVNLVMCISCTGCMVDGTCKDQDSTWMDDRKCEEYRCTRSSDKDGKPVGAVEVIDTGTMTGLLFRIQVRAKKYSGGSSSKVGSLRPVLNQNIFVCHEHYNVWVENDQ